MSLHQFDYSKHWKTGLGDKIPWPLVDNSHLRNILLLLARKGTGPEELHFEFPDAAFYFCMKEIKRRNIQGWTDAKDEYHFNRIKEEFRTKLLNKTKEEPMKSRYDSHENGGSTLSPMATDTPPSFTLEDLVKLFGRKVKILGKNKTGKVVGIYHPDYPRTTMNHGFNLKVSDEAGSIQQLQYGDVEVIQEVELFLYENKAGTVEWTSKKKNLATMKRQKTKLLTTKFIEV